MRASHALLPLLGLGFTSLSASGQSYEELQREVQELRSRNAALAAVLEEMTAARGLEPALQADDRPKGIDAVVVSYDPATTRLVVRIGDRQRTIDLKPEMHLHDENDFEVRPPQRAEKLKPGARIALVEEAGQLVEINLGAARPRGHDHDHAHDDEWRWIDPFYKGWRQPTDDYRPYSWKPPPSQGFFKDLLFGQFVDAHRSSSGTPWVHPFTIEPPQLHRDAFFIYAYTRGADAGELDEHELELHVDWALTRRFGLLIGVPYLGLVEPDSEEPGAHLTGFADLEIGPRFVFIESDAYFLSANLIMSFPTGDAGRDLGAGETIIAPYLTSWNDLGGFGWLPWRNWNTMFTNFGPEYGVASGDGTFNYTVVLAHSFLGPRLLFPHHHGNGNGHAHGNGNGPGHDGHAHNGHAARGGTISVFGPAHPAGLTTFQLEFNGQSELQGDRLTFLQLLTGLSYALTENAELRFGVNFPINRTAEQFDTQYIFAFEHTF